MRAALVPFQSEALGDLLIKICIHPIPVPSQIAMVPPGFDAWWAKASSRDPNLRFQSGKDLAEALRQVLMPDVGNANSSGPMSPAVAVMGASNTVGASPLHVSAFTPAGPHTPGGAYTPPPGAYGQPQQQGPTLQSAGSQPGYHPSQPSQHPSQPGHYPSQPPGPQQYTPLPPGQQQHYTPQPPHYTTAPGAAVNVVQPPQASRGPLIALGVGVAVVLSGVGIWLVLGNNGHHDHRGSQATTQSTVTTATPLAVIPTPPGPDAAPAPTPVVSAAPVATTHAVVPVKGQHPAPIITIVLPPPPPPPPPATVTKPPDRVGF